MDYIHGLGIINQLDRKILMEATITQALKKGEKVVIILYEQFDVNKLGEHEDKAYISQIMTGVTPYITYGLPIDKLLEYAAKFEFRLNFINNPFFLYAINNRIMKHLVMNKVNKSEEEYMPKIEPLDPDTITVFEFRQGVLCPLQDGLGLIRDNCLDRVMKNIMADFHNLLNYYEPE